MNGRKAMIEGESVPAFADGWALFLDVDGTLLDIAQTPGGVAVSPHLHHVLEAAFRLIDLWRLRPQAA